MFDHTPIHSRHTLRDWIAGLGPTRQLGYGCLGVAIAGMFALYCAGTVSLLVRPILFQLPTAPVPTFVIATAAFIQTQPPALITLPSGPVPKTPTQGRIPTREPSTATPTPDPFVTPSVTNAATLGTPRASITATIRASATPTRR